MFAQSVVFFSLFYAISIVFTLSCSDWFLVWAGLEVNMMSFISLVYSRSSSGVEVCLKYFFIQSLGSGILMMMFFTEFYWFDFLSLSVLSYKMGGGPFYFWFPSICDSLGWGSCYLLMTVQKFLPLLLISLLVSMFLWVIVFMSLFMGGFGAMNQKSVKRLMAYSSVHHSGWMLVGNFVSFYMWLVYLVMYGLMLLGVVMILWKDKILEVGSLKNMSSKWSFSLGLLSMGGMPPMLGFYLKWWLIYYLMWVDFSMLLLMILMSILMFYVYLRLVYGVILGGGSVSGWSVASGENKMKSGDALFMMGVNIGLCSWLMF